ncbi:uroporphyrinogen-III synthase [Jannaschia formosa]|uniref:uroporphyrinogen-III synthase n=1 Tax=Jannaschia formosa TaxID=2259592 RepID=UPI000E1B8A55|nr:uroporphyrinogen-III synthase [Jannaschia formosa]TFL16587.1 uroporphyrinogen-III synthase [Jannaschia formosa]
MAPVLPVLLTRPAEASAPMATRLRALGASVVEAPLMRITFAEALPDLAPGLIFTSRNGVAAYRALGGPGGRPVWCVGPRTGEAAEAAGLDLRGVAPDAEALAWAVPEGAPPLLHLRGAAQRGDLAAALRARGLAARDAVVYAQEALPLGPAARAVLERGAVVPLYSPRSAALLAQACPDAAWERLRLLSLSPAVAAALPVASEIAEAPDGAAMWALLLRVLDLSAVEGQDGSD